MKCLYTLKIRLLRIIQSISNLPKYSLHNEHQSHFTGLSGVTVPIITQYQLSLAMHYGISGVLFFALRVVGLGSVLIACKKTLNDTVTISGVKIT